MVNLKEPHDYGAEDAVLGALLIDSDAINDIILILQPHDFFKSQNQWIYESCVAVHSRNESINQITVGRELDQRGDADVGGSRGLTKLITDCPSSVDAIDYAKIVANLGLMRRLIKVSSEIRELGFKADPDVAETLSKSAKLIANLHGNTLHQGIVAPHQASEELLEYLGRVKDDTAALSYGFSNLDRITGGIFPGEYLIIAARPSMGKTELMQQMTEKFNSAGKTGLWISLEMLRQPGLMERWISTSTGIDITKIRRRELTEMEWGDVYSYAYEVENKPVYFLDGDLNIEQIASYIRQLSLDVKLDYVMLDYIQLVKDCVMGDNMNTAVTKVSRVIKNTAKQTGIPIIAASQLNRELEKRDNKRPRLSDLRESGSLEQDADVVWMLYRDYIYNPETTKEPDITEIKMAKNRQLGTKSAEKLRWDKNTRRLYDVIYSEVN